MGLTNNDIFKKLRVAHKLTNDDIVSIMGLAGFKVSKSELGAIFRSEDHPKYVECGDQYLRNFLDGLIIHLRGPKSEKQKQHKKRTGKRENTPHKEPSAHKKKSFKSEKLIKKKRRRVNRKPKDDNQEN